MIVAMTQGMQLSRLGGRHLGRTTAAETTTTRAIVAHRSPAKPKISLKTIGLKRDVAGRVVAPMKRATSNQLQRNDQKRWAWNTAKPVELNSN